MKTGVPRSFASIVESILILVLITTTINTIQSSYASCAQYSDWPEKLCLDTPPYLKEELKQAWDKYYELKGKAWMEMKKTEMDQAIKDGSLKEWVEFSPRNNFANHNVYFYYYLHDQALDINYYSDVIRDNSKPIVTYWYVSPMGWMMIVTISAIGVIAASYVFRRGR